MGSDCFSSLSLHTFYFCSERLPLPLGAWDGLCYFIVALRDLPYNFLR